MSPERFEGHCSERADIYALGLTLYELLLLRPAFRSTSRGAMIDQILRQDPPSPRSLDSRIPLDLETIILRAIDKEPERRYRTAEDLAEDLARFIRDEPVKARRISNSERLWRWSRRNKGLAASLSCVLVLLVGVAVGSTIVAARFRGEREVQAGLARDNARLAREKEGEAARATAGWQVAESRRRAMQANQYAAEMILAGEAVREPGGITRVAELTESWLPERAGIDLRGWEWYYLQSRCDRELVTLDDPDGRYEAQGLSWSPDSKRLVVGADWGAAQIWNVDKQGVELALLDPSTRRLRVTAAEWSPEGSHVAVSVEGDIRIFRTTDGREIVRAHAAPGLDSSHPSGVDWSSDSKSLAWGASEGVFVLDRLDNATPRLLGTHGDTVMSVAWSPDRTRVASSGMDRKVRVWNVAPAASSDDSETSPEKLEPQKLGPEFDVEWKAPVASIRWHPTFPFLLAGAADGRIQMWDVDRKTLLFDREAHGDWVCQVRFSPDGSQFGTASVDRTAGIWDFSNARRQRTLRGHTVRLTGIRWSPDGTRIATSSWDSTIKIWDAKPTGDDRPLDGPRRAAVFWIDWSPDGTRIATAGSAGAIKTWLAATGERLTDLGVQHPYAALSPDGTKLASTGGQTKVKVLDATTGRLVAEFDESGNRNHSVRWSPDGSLIAATSDDKKLRVWNLASQERVLLVDVAEVMRTTEFSPDGEQLVVACMNGNVMVFDVQSGDRVHRLDSHRTGVHVARWSPDGRWIASGSIDTRVVIWDAVNGGEPTRVLNGHRDSVRGLCWSPDGSRLATGGDDRKVKIWNASTGAEPVTIHEHEQAITCVAWSPDGTRVASATKGGTVRIWDASLGYSRERERR